MTPSREGNSYWQAFEESTDFFDPAAPAIIEPELVVVRSDPVPVEGTRLEHHAITYRELLDDVTRLASSLARLGVGPGERVLLMIPMSIALYQAMLAVLKTGGICLFVDPSDGVLQLDRIASKLAPRAFVGSPKAQKLRLFCPSLTRIPLHVSTGPSSPAAELLDDLIQRGDPTFQTAAVAPDDAAIISFTSGSSGAPKGVRRTHHDLRAQFRMMCLHPGKKLKGVNFCAFPVLPIDDISYGRTAVLAAVKPGKIGEADPKLLLEQLKAYPPALVSCAPPMLEAILAEARRQNVTLDTVKHVFTGGGNVPLAVIDLARERMPGAAVNLIYGSTEAEPIAWITGAEIAGETARRTADGEGICVGRPAPDVEIAIVVPREEPLTQLEPVDGIGELLVAGPHVNREYFENPEETRRNKLHDPATGRWWHRTGDLVQRGADGRLWLMGRIATRVVVGGATLYPGQIEPLFDLLPGVRRAALCAIPVVQGGVAKHAAAVLLELEPDADRAAVLARARSIVTERSLAVACVQEVQRIPLDARIGAKILYHELVARYGPLIRQQLSDPFGPRFSEYLAERFPPPVLGVMALVFTAGIAAGAVGTWWQTPFALGFTAFAVFLFFFHLRVYDELKDGEEDRITHPDRVLSRGIVTTAELVMLDANGIVAMGAIALGLGMRALLWWALAMVYAWLMRHEFFLGDWLRRRIVLYGITHSAVVYLLAQFAAAGLGGEPPFHSIGVLALTLAWMQEIARKLDPGDAGPNTDSRDSDESYVVEIGLTRTAALLAVLEAAALALALRIGWRAGLGSGFTIGVGSMAALAGLATLGFVRAPSRKTGKKALGAVLLLALACYGCLAGGAAWK